MNDIVIRNPGVAALEISIGTRRILIDAFNSINKEEPVNPGDILLFTHDDGDHFQADIIPDIKGSDISVIGPPSIVKPLIGSGKAELEQIRTINSQSNRDPIVLEFDGFHIQGFSTQHFNHWNPIHNSYLIQTDQSRIYITGDSFLTRECRDFIGEADVIVCNLVDEGFITGREDKRFAVHHHLSYLLRILSDFRPKKIIGVHLINFSGTVDPEDMKKLTNAYGFDNIIIPTSSDELIHIDMDQN